MKGIVLKVKSPKNFYSRRKDIAYFFKRYGLFTMFLLSILIGFAVGIYAGTHNGEDFRKSFDFLFPTDFDGRKQLDFIGLFSSNFAPMFLFFITVFFLAFCVCNTLPYAVFILFCEVYILRTILQLHYNFRIIPLIE
ncbi:MAG: hypothetical protein ACI4RI_01375, partial [Ruminococcus sp.]